MKLVWVTLEFDGIHRWPKATEEVRWLSFPHRHLFRVKACVQVVRDDREVEFFILRDKIRKFIDSAFVKDSVGCYLLDDHSCESIAGLLSANFNLYEVEVSEDGQNGAVVRCEP